MDKDEAIRQLEEYVTKSDLELIKCCGNLIDCICNIIAIFSDRNSMESSSAAAFGVVSSLITGLFKVKVDSRKLIDLIVESPEV